MANVAKYAKTAVVRLGMHYSRELDENGEPVKFNNVDIDLTRSHLNYNLAPDRNMPQYAFMKKRTTEVRCLNRKDVNVMASWVVTAPKDFPEDRQKEFFEKTYEFLKNRYDPSEENVISAYVHMDETFPHMHYAFVPVTTDRKRGDLKVSASEVVNRTDLRSFHTDLTNALEKHFGFRVGILNDATRDGNKSIEELKRGTAIEKLKQAESELSDVSQEVNALLTQKLALSSLLNDVLVESDELDRLKGLKTANTMFGKTTIEPDFLEQILELAKRALLALDELTNVRAKLTDMTERYKEMKTEYSRELTGFLDTKNELKRSEKRIDALESALDKKTKAYDKMEQSAIKVMDFVKAETGIDYIAKLIESQQQAQDQIAGQKAEVQIEQEGPEM